MESFLDDLMPSVLNEYNDICKCEKCIQDIKAMTLNRLKPMYVSTEQGHVYTKVNLLLPQFKTDIVREIVAAIEVVGANPRHS
jgi:competence protein ComFB